MEKAKRAAPCGSGSSKPALMSMTRPKVNARAGFAPRIRPGLFSRSRHRYLSGMDQSPPPIGVAVFPVTPLQQNCTLVWCRKTMKAAIIDPGASVDGLLGAVAKQGLTLEAIWITHGHLDHAGGAAEMQEKTGLDIIGPHPADQFWIDGIPEQGRRYGLPEARSFTPTRWLADGDVLTLGETTWEVVHCPGHTPGHVVFFNREGRFAQVGDVLFQGSIGTPTFRRATISPC